MAVDAVASVILQKLMDLISEKSFTNNEVIGSQLREMQVAMEKMRGYFIDAADNEKSAEAIKKWTDDYLRHLYDVEDSIESFALRITRQRKKLGFLMNHALFLKKFTACKMLSRKLERIRRKIDVLNDKKPAGLEDASLRSIISTQRDSAVVSSDCGAGERGDAEKDEEKEEEEEDLISSMRGNNNTSIVSIKEGSPPRSLLRSNSFKLVSLRDASLHRERFQKAKLMYSYSYDEEVLSIVGYERQRSDQWGSLKDTFPDEENRSKILLPTCDKQVALLAGPKSQPHSLKKLNYEESWTLFLEKVGLQEGPKGSLKERIIKVCSGLPLNIVLLGSLLSTKKDKDIEEEWTRILDNQGNLHTSDILMLNYNDLDAHLKLCLLYMVLFPKALDIPVRRLQRLWLAEGFVKRPQDQDIFLEDEVQMYFDNLVKRSLILVSKPRSDGSPRKCRLLGVLHDFLLAKAQDISLFHVHPRPACYIDGSLGKRRLVEHADGKNCSLESREYQRLRSYITFNSQKKDTPAKHVGNLLSNMIGKGFGLLRVLDLEGVYKPSLPDNLGDLFHLRYLGLRWTFLDKLPKSVGQLPYLEILDLKHTYINRIPPSIWKLKHLRHLNLDEIHLDKDMPLQFGCSLPKLLTLWGLSVDHESPVKNGLSKLTHLRELGISFRLSKRDDNTIEGNNGLSTFPQFTEELVDWISKLTTLRSLRLRSKDDSGCPADLCFKPLSDLSKLSHMNLLGKLQNLPHRDHFPPNIKVLTLSVSQLYQDPMPILGQIPSLTVLRLLANSYLGEEIVCPRGTFKGLEVLKLWMLKDLKKWKLEDGAMGKLKELNIRCCPKLETIPSRLLQQGTFKDLILTNMPKKFKENVEINNTRKVSITAKYYEFTPLPWEHADDAPNGMAYGINGHANGGA